MFKGFSPAAVDFLWDVGFYNERTWFEEHKQEYLDLLYRPLSELAEETRQAVNATGSGSAFLSHVARIYRDARRSHGQGPYKYHLWFTLRPPVDDDWWARPTLWFEIGPREWSYGMGYYQARPATMERHRRRIDRHPRALQKLARQLEEQGEFALEGPDYARPKGDPGPKLRPWYNKRTLALSHREPPGEALYAPDLADRLSRGFIFLLPYHDYFASLETDAELEQEWRE